MRVLGQIKGAVDAADQRARPREERRLIPGFLHRQISVDRPPHDFGLRPAPRARRPLNPDFELNQPRYQGAQILLARRNFGCGSSREHAPWALGDYGFRAIIAPSFADIFFNNCFKNGLLPIMLTEADVERLFHDVAAFPGFKLTIDLERQTVATTDGGTVFAFDVDAFRKHCLLNGLDDIALTLNHADEIRAFEAKRKAEQPWLF